MTEEEAKTKWCPMVRIVREVNCPPLTNRDMQLVGVVGEATTCIASECMWWVEDDWIKTRIKGQTGHFTNEPAGHCGAIK